MAVNVLNQFCRFSFFYHMYYFSEPPVSLEGLKFEIAEFASRMFASLLICTVLSQIWAKSYAIEEVKSIEFWPFFFLVCNIFLSLSFYLIKFLILDKINQCLKWIWVILYSCLMSRHLFCVFSSRINFHCTQQFFSIFPSPPNQVFIISWGLNSS